MLGSSPAVRRAAHPAAIRRDWATFSSVLMQRQTALRELYPAATSVPRALAALLALALAFAGSALLRPGIAGEPWGPVQAPILLVGGLLLVVAAAALGLVLIRAGGPAVSATLAWAVLPTVVTEDGRRQRRADPLTMRQHQAVAEVGRLLTPGPLRIRQVGAVLLVLATIATTALAIGPVVEQTRAYANSATLGAMIAALVRAGACWWLAIAACLGAWRLTVARNGGTGPGGRAARVWTLRRAGMDVTGAGPHPTQADDQRWADDAGAALPPVTGPGGHGARLQGEGAFTSASPGDFPLDHEMAHEPFGQWSPGTPQPSAPQPVAVRHPDPGPFPDPSPHPSPHQPLAEMPAWSQQMGASERRAQAGGPSAATPSGHLPRPVTGAQATFGSHALPAWAETGEWEEVPDVRVGGYLLDGGVTLVGRDPEPRAGEIVDNLMVVPDPSMSKTHLSVRLSAGTLHVIDRASTNGTVLLAADGTATPLQPWQEIEVPDGAALRIGDSLLERDDPWAEDEDDAGQTVLR